MLVVVFCGLFGLIIGSFLNVLILRWGIRTLGGRSACPACGKQIAWYDNVPLVSWLLLRGRCRSCGVHISLQYPVVEALTGVLFAFGGGWATMAFPAHPVAVALLLGDYLMIVALLVAISVYDLKYMLIPDAWSYLFIAFAFVSLFFSGTSFPGTFALLGAPVAAAPLFIVWAISRGAWMGFGDVKLAFGIGWLLGPLLGIYAVFFAFVIGAVVGVPLLVFSSDWWKRFTHTDSSSKRRFGFTMKSEIPFGPFLVCSCIIIWYITLYGFDPLALIGLPL